MLFYHDSDGSAKAMRLTDGTGAAAKGNTYGAVLGLPHRATHMGQGQSWDCRTEQHTWGRGSPGTAAQSNTHGAGAVLGLPHRATHMGQGQSWDCRTGQHTWGRGSPGTAAQSNTHGAVLPTGQHPWGSPAAHRAIHMGQSFFFFFM